MERTADFQGIACGGATHGHIVRADALHDVTSLGQQECGTD
jgi:hypothetical protein